MVGTPRIAERTHEVTVSRNSVAPFSRLARSWRKYPRTSCCVSVEPPWGKRSRTAPSPFHHAATECTTVLYATLGSARYSTPEWDEEVLVLGRQDGVAQDGRHLVVGHDPAMLPRELDQHLAASVVDSPGARSRSG